VLSLLSSFFCPSGELSILSPLVCSGTTRMITKFPLSFSLPHGPARLLSRRETIFFYTSMSASFDEAFARFLPFPPLARSGRTHQRSFPFRRRLWLVSLPVSNHWHHFVFFFVSPHWAAFFFPLFSFLLSCGGAVLSRSLSNRKRTSALP